MADSLKKDVTSNESIHILPQLDQEKNTATVTSSNSTSESKDTDQEVALVNDISSILIDYLLSQMPKSTSSDAGDTQEQSQDNRISLTTTHTTVAPTESVISNQSSAIVQTIDYEKILQRVKTLVDGHLSMNIQNANQVCQTSNHYQHVHQDPDTNATHNSRRQLYKLRNASFHEESIDEKSKSPVKARPKLDLLFKTQSLDDTELGMFEYYSISVYRYKLILKSKELVIASHSQHHINRYLNIDVIFL